MNNISKIVILSFLYLSITFVTNSLAQSTPDSSRLLFDGATMNGWSVSEFSGHGSVTVQDSSIIIEKGSECSGIRCETAIPKINYEISLDAMRVDGRDFFCGFTFPYNDEFCSLIISGWGGNVVGLSSIDGIDASGNFTGIMRHYQNNRWYHIVLRVTDGLVEAWVDSDKIVEMETAGHKLSIRKELNLSRPLGIATWKTTAAIRNIKIKTVH